MGEAFAFRFGPVMTSGSLVTGVANQGTLR
jgi:hypothetical protein